MTDSESLVIPRRIVDTNIIIRFLVGDNEVQAQKARSLFVIAEEGRLVLVIPEIVLIEVVHVLHKIYRLEKSSIANAIRNLARFPGVEILTPSEVLIQGLANFESVNAPWSDALIAAYAICLDIPEVYSFDAHLGKFEKIERIAP